MDAETETHASPPPEAERYMQRGRRRQGVSAESSAASTATSARVVVPKSAAAQEHIREAAKKSVVFAHLPNAQLQEIADAMVEVNVKPGEDLIKQGDTGDFFYIVETGEFEFIVHGNAVGVAGPGRSFGELALMYNCPRAATVRAKEPSKVWALDRTTFRNILVHSNTEKRNLYENFLENVSILEPLSKLERFILADALEEVEYAEGGYIIRQGEAGDAFFILVEGEATIFRTPNQGEEPIELRRLESGDYFGEVALLTDKPRNANVVAFNGPAKALRLSNEVFTRLMGPCEDILRQNIKHFQKMFEVFLEQVPFLSSLTAFERQRIAKALQPMQYKENDVVIRQGDRGDRFFIVEMGSAAAYQTPATGGDPVEVMKYSKGDYFGELAMLTDAPRAASIVAKGNLSCVTLNRDQFNELLGPCEEILMRNMSQYKAYEHLVKEMQERRAQEAASNPTPEAPASTPSPIVGGRERKRRTAISAPSMDSNTTTQEKRVIEKSKDAVARLRKIIKSSFLFSHLDPDQIQELVDAFAERRVVIGEDVIRQFDEGDNFYVVEDGIFDIFVAKDRTSEPKKVVQVTSGGSFGELALMYNCPRAATVRAASNGLLWALDSISFRRIMMDSSDKKRRMYEKFLEQVPILNPLSEFERFRVADALEEINFKDSEHIIREGEEGNAFFILESGEAIVYKTPAGSDTEPVELKRLYRGDYFGEIALLTSKPRAANVISYGPCRVLRLASDAFVRLLGPCEELLRQNLQHYKKVYETFLDQVPILSSLNKEERRAMSDQLQQVTYKDGDFIITQGEKGDRFFILLEGKAYCTRSPAPGLPAGRLAKDYTKGDYFGEVALITNNPRRANIIADGEVKCVYLERSKFIAILGPLEVILKRNMEHYKAIEAELERDMLARRSSASSITPADATAAPVETTASDSDSPVPLEEKAIPDVTPTPTPSPATPASQPKAAATEAEVEASDKDKDQQAPEADAEKATNQEDGQEEVEEGDAADEGEPSSPSDPSGKKKKKGLSFRRKSKSKRDGVEGEEDTSEGGKKCIVM
eukprot:TRINITY_DN77_c0_g1_i1.p1 TRINITY_DN77_c0_g1~~TRINITY_DN77_c0_g1_i1.p1  ORF type:complete len:1050 (-),score=238.82 TRINITY_DN77_c0_g1_i1:530-3679(-)